MLGEGQQFAGYTIERQLGAGGMGEVYLARHPRLPRRDALKILRPELSTDPDFRARFIREADLAAALTHPHIVTVHDRGEYDGQLWIATAYIDGTDAAHLLRARYPAGMPTDEATTITTAIAAALDYAHDRGLLHRDVKPANILLSHPDHTGQRQIYLADFGIARPLTNGPGLTATNTTLGTFAYSAPEQLMGEALDGRTDQYALAATAFHLLVGRQVFEGSNQAAVIGRHLTEPAPAPSSIRPDLAPYDAAFARALAKTPADRFPRCVDFAQALADAGVVNVSFAATQQAPAASDPPPPAVAPPVASTGPGRATITLLTLLGLALVAALAFVGLQLRGAKQSATPPAYPPASPSTAVSSPAATSPSKPSPPPTTATATASPTSATPAAVPLPIRDGSALISTPSGKTACQIDIDAVGCQVAFTFTPPPVSECPGITPNGIIITTSGDRKWVCGDIGGGRTFTTLTYGTAYSALGWTIQPTSQGTTFTNTATGHGMFVSVQQVRPF